MTLKGIDVSSWQTGIDFSKVPSDFGIVKATGGIGYVNPACNGQMASLIKAGKRKGLYHFAHEVGCPGSAVAEADFFVNNIKGYLDGKTLLVLDFEGDNQFDAVWALTWLNRVFSLTKVRPLIYLNGQALQGANWSGVWAGNYGLWLAWYAVSTPTSGYQYYNGANVDTITPPFKCAMWQFSSTAQLSGWNGGLDANVFYGDGAAWDAYCRPVGAAAPAPKPVTIPKPVHKPVPVKVVAKTYTVKSGDTLSLIGSKVGVAWTTIASLNGIKAPYTIYPGQVLKLSGVVPAARTYTVKSGDSLSLIGPKVGVAWGTIASLNGIKPPYVIYPGQVLRLPAK